MLEFRILGPLEVCRREQPLRLPGSASRRVLAALAVSRGAWVSTDRLIDELWPGGAPPSGRKALQMHIARLRRALAASADPEAGAVLASGPAGYRLGIAPEQVDAARFERLVEEGHGALAAAEPERARRLLVTALALWRGPPLGELSLQGETAAEARRLEELQLVALEHRIEADLQLGRHADVIGELQRLIGQHEWRERLHAQLMLALYRAGRQVDALQVYRHAREVLVEQLGLEPGPELHDLERAILGHDASLRPAAPPSGPFTAPPPALRTGALPAPPTRLIGRGRERRELARLLGDRDIRLVTLVGPGGVGKTRLALAAASDAQAAFRDGVHWVELAAVARPEHVASSIARALAITPLSGETGENAVIRFLAPKQLLLTIDNFEHLVAAAPLIAQLLADCPAVTVLATSRQALDLRAEHCYPVMLLAVPPAPERATEIELEQTEATALFLDAARRHGSALKVTGNAPAIAELCARLDGLPLALELAAAHTTIMGPEQLAARLDRALSELASRARDVPERQRTLRATLEWSHRLLTAEERESFASFGVFAGGATLDAAQAVTEASIDALTGLAAKQLLYRDDSGSEPRLAILETVRTFALERLADRPDADVVARRHCEYYVALAEPRDPTPFVDPQPEWLATLDRDIDNLRAALSWALANDPDAALKLAPSLGEYWVHRASIDEGLRALHSVLEAAGPDAPVRDLARIHSLRADLFWRTDDVQAAEEAACNSLQMAQAAADHAGIALALSHLVVAALLQGRRDEAREHGREALRQARAAHDDRLTANALAWLAPCLPWEQGRPVYDEAVTLLTRVGNQRFLCGLHSNMAFAAMRENRNEEASALLDEAMRLAVQLDDAWTMTSCLGNVGLNALLSGDRERAREAFADQLRISRSQGFHAHAGEGLVGLAAIAATEQDPARAARLLGAAIRVSPVGVPWIEQLVEERFIARAREALSSSAWCASTDAGGQMTFADAIGYALEGSDR